jgi:hypothetical protein
MNAPRRRAPGCLTARGVCGHHQRQTVEVLRSGQQTVVPKPGDIVTVKVTTPAQSL